MRSARETLLAQRSAHQRRLDELEIKRATFGINVPIEIGIEISDIQNEIFKIDSSIEAVERLRDIRLAADVDVNGDRRDFELKQHIMVATVQATVAEFASLRKFVTDGFSQQNRKILVFGVGVVVIMLINMVMLAMLLSVFIHLNNAL